MENEIKTFIFLKKGKIRKKILETLDEPKTATEISKELNLHRSSVSRILIGLNKKGLIKCINPEDNNFRHYIKK